MTAEEQRCGMLCRLGDAPKSTLKSTAAAASIVATSSPPLSCVIKVQSSDWQLNEVNADGDVVTLLRCPRPRWRKVKRAKTYLVEDDSAENFSDPSKSFTPRTQNHGVYMRQLGKVTEQNPLLHFTMYRDSHSTLSVRNRMRYEVGIDESATEFGSELGGFGCVTQEGVAVGVSADMIAHASRLDNIHPLVFDPLRTCSLEALTTLRRPPRGNLFRMVLRCVEGTPEEIESKLRRLSEGGAINYFDLGRFQATSNHSHEIAAYAATGDFYHAVSYVLQSMAERNALHYDCYLKHVNAEKGIELTFLREWLAQAVKLKSDAKTVQFLKQLVAACANGEVSQSSLAAVWRSVPHHPSVYFHSGAEFVWNAMASQRLMTHGLRVVPGDIVQQKVRAREGQLGHLAHMGEAPSYRNVSSHQEASLYSIEDVVLPVPYADRSHSLTLFPTANGSSRGDYERFASAHRLGYLFDPPSDVLGCLQEDTPVRRCVDGYRPLVVLPQTLRFSVLHDPNSFAALKSDHFLFQERAPLNVCSSLDTHRIREPCVYNVSERFVEKMQPILQARRRHEHSVVVQGFLPRGSHPSVLLREAFEISHGSFSDLLEPS